MLGGPAPQAAASVPHAWTSAATRFAVPAGYRNVQMDGVACPSASRCIAVGSQFQEDQPTAVAELWLGASWVAMGLPAAAGGELSAVACPTVSLCLAVGRRRAEQDGAFTPLAYVWQHGAWSEMQTPGTGAERTDLMGVSCSSGSYCMAVGDAGGADTWPFAERWSEGRWNITPTLALGASSHFGSVSCPSRRWCVAAGATHQGQYGRPLLEHWNGARWSILAARGLPPITARQSTWETGLSSVSCTSASYCVAVGNVMLDWGGKRWAAAKGPASRLEYRAVSCAAHAGCAAVGRGTNGPVLEQSAKGEWSAAVQPKAPNAWLEAVSLYRDGSGMAVGYSTSPAEISPFAERRRRV